MKEVSGGLPLAYQKKPFVCPEDKSKCTCLTTCPTELSEDCPDKCNPEKCCQGCMAAEEENEGE